MRSATGLTEESSTGRDVDRQSQERSAEGVGRAFAVPVGG